VRIVPLSSKQDFIWEISETRSLRDARCPAIGAFVTGSCDTEIAMCAFHEKPMDPLRLCNSEISQINSLQRCHTIRPMRSSEIPATLVPNCIIVLHAPNRYADRRGSPQKQDFIWEFSETRSFRDAGRPAVRAFVAGSCDTEIAMCALHEKPTDPLKLCNSEISQINSLLRCHTIRPMRSSEIPATPTPNCIIVLHAPTGAIEVDQMPIQSHADRLVA
jgi:hypothetical protein